MAPSGGTWSSWIKWVTLPKVGGTAWVLHAPLSSTWRHTEMFTLGAKSSTYEILKFWHHGHSILSFQNCKKYVSIAYKLFNLEYQLAYLRSSQIHATYAKKKKRFNIHLWLKLDRWHNTIVPRRSFPNPAWCLIDGLKVKLGEKEQGSFIMLPVLLRTGMNSLHK